MPRARAQTTRARYICSRVQVRRAWHVRVTVAVGAVFSVRSIQAAMAPLPRPTSASIVKERCRPRSISESSVSESVRLCDTHIPAYGRPISVVCNDIPRDIPERDPPRTYIRTHARTYVLCENRSPIQSLALMRSAIILDV